MSFLSHYILFCVNIKILISFSNAHNVGESALEVMLVSTHVCDVDKQMYKLIFGLGRRVLFSSQ